MAICGSRSELIETKIVQTKTGLIWWMNDGVTSHESHREVPNGNVSSGLLGKALDATGNRTNARTNNTAVNSRAVQAAP